MEDTKRFELNDDALDEVAGGCYSEEPVTPTPGGGCPFKMGDMVRAYCPTCGKVSDLCVMEDNWPDPDIHPGEYLVKCLFHGSFYTKWVEAAPPLMYDPLL